jgi:hypothetical protein
MADNKFCCNNPKQQVIYYLKKRDSIYTINFYTRMFCYSIISFFEI